MKTQKYSENQGLAFGSDLQSPLHLKIQRASPILSSQEQILSKEEISDDHVQNAKYTMQTLCRSFLKKYANTNVGMEPSIIATQFNAKLRRVYDLTNILEGSGIIQKVEKGVYKWKGLNSQKQLPIDTIKNDWCSLRSISFEINRLFNKMKKGLTCNDLHVILTDGNKNRFNPATIRRKIYECCKVFVIAGLIQKSGKFFYSAKMTNRQIQSLKREKIEEDMIDQVQKISLPKLNSPQSLFSQSIERQRRYEGWQNYKKENSVNLQQRKAIIRKIVNQIENQSDLNKFIQDLSFEYQSKKLSYFKMKKQENVNFKYESPQNLTTYECSPRSSSQIQRNIIISSPVKDQYPQFFDNGNSNNCFISSQIVGFNFTEFEPFRNIKGK